MWCGDAVVDMRLGDFLVFFCFIGLPVGTEGCGLREAGLENVERAPHVPAREFEEGVDRGGSDADLFGGDDMLDAFAEGGDGEGGEAEAGAAGEERGVEFVRVVGDDAEAGVGGVSALVSTPHLPSNKGNKEVLLLHNPSQRILCRTRHRIRLIQHNQLKAPEPIALPLHSTEDLPCRGKRLDLFPHNIDTSIVGSIQLQHLLPYILCAVDLSCECENSRRFTGTGRTVEEKVREPVAGDKAVDGLQDVFVAGNIVKGVGAVFLDPISTISTLRGW